MGIPDSSGTLRLVRIMFTVHMVFTVKVLLHHKTRIYLLNSEQQLTLCRAVSTHYIIVILWTLTPSFIM